MKRNFDMWLNTFQKRSIANYGYYVDFDKVYDNVAKIEPELCLLGCLIGAEDIENKFERLVEEYPKVLQCIPLLLAVRQAEIDVMDQEGSYRFNFKKPNYSTNEYKMFMRKTGLFDLLSRHIIANVKDYVTGVETGLDSNGRKNRGGHLMENLVENYICEAGFRKGINYFKEMYIHEITEKWNINLDAISNQGTTEKRFDFVVKTDRQIYVIETNFYTSGGSKLNETARSYKTLANEINTIPGITFVWLTDGAGWKSARHNLQETFDVMDTVFNIQDMKNGIFKSLFS